MTLKRIRAAAAALMIGTLLVACSASQEKIDTAKAGLESMTAARAAAEEAYLDITDNSRQRELEILAKEADELAVIEIEKLSSKRADAFISQVKDLENSYKSMGAEFAATLNEENLQRQEIAKHKQYNVYIINKSGKDIAQLKFHDVKMEYSTPQLLGDENLLKDGYTLMGTTIDIYDDSREWVFLAEEENGTEHFFRCEGLENKDLNGKTIVLSFDPDSGEARAALSE